ncbi:MAG: 4Fe-4S binding protein [Anaerolineales bacterium]|nr:4Fe-4S binding protein [Anaerolineales bacterium]
MKKIRFFRPRSIWVRSIVQLFFFALIALIVVNNTLIENQTGFSIWPRKASIHALCPFGGVVTLYQLVTTGQLVQKVHDSSVVLMGLVFLLAVLFGPVFCGWVCPLGTVQEWVSRMGRKRLRRKFNHLVPHRLDLVLRFGRYLVLAWVLYATAQSGRLVFQAYDPYFALFHFWTSEVAPTALLILGLTLGFSLLVERPWCKYACPYGALLGISNLFRVFSIRRIVRNCRSDGACGILCPMNIPVDNLEVVRDHQCISCLECTSEACCPVKDTVVFATGDVK